MTQQARISYVFIAVMLLLVGFLRLATPFITVLFCYFALKKLRFGRGKLVAVTLLLVMVTGLGYGFYYFMKQAYLALPRIANTAIPVVINYAEKQGIEPPFSDYESLKELAMQSVAERMSGWGRHAKELLVQIASFIVGVVVAISLFLNARFDFGQEPNAAKDNLYLVIGNEIADRFRSFYRSFETVMGAQLTIALINATLTGIFLFWNDFPYRMVITVLTFACGLLPIVGNLISNTLILSVAFTISPRDALIALIFLVVIHKLEYFLNSKIIGDRIRNPMWLTLLALILGEKLMGIPGIILAPVVLHYVKTEVSRNRISPPVPDKAGAIESG
jgi:predicted PurR-regulated permease PerM